MWHSRLRRCAGCDENSKNDLRNDRRRDERTARNDLISTSPNTEGREVRSVKVDSGAIGDYSNAIEDIYDDRLDAIVIRNAFPLDVAAEVVDRLHSDSSLPWLRPNRIGPNADIHVLGVPATPTFESPGGPEVEAYFEAGAKYDEVIRTVFPDTCNPVSYTEDFLGRVSGGRPVEVVQESGGRRSASSSLRSLPEGQSIIVHNDHYHFKLAVYAKVVSNL